MTKEQLDVIENTKDILYDVGFDEIKELVRLARVGLSLETPVAPIDKETKRDLLLAKMAMHGENALVYVSVNDWMRTKALAEWAEEHGIPALTDLKRNAEALDSDSMPTYLVELGCEEALAALPKKV